MSERYINPFTDFGFKKLFGEESNKDLLIDFLNELILDKREITDITYLKNEQLPNSPVDRRAIFDLYCENDRGEKFIVELQKVKQEFFKDRSLYYATFPIQEQAATGRDWNFRLQSVYTISIMDFVFDRTKENDGKFKHYIQLADIETHEVFYDKLAFIYLEMPKFDKSVDKLDTRFDKWMYLLKNLSRLQNIPHPLQERIFQKLFKTAEIANLNTKDRYNYIDSLKHYRDMVNTTNTAIKEGREKGRVEGLKEGKAEGRAEGLKEGKAEGRAEGRVEGRAEGEKAKAIEVARNLKAQNVDIATIARATGLSEIEIKAL